MGRQGRTRPVCEHEGPQHAGGGDEGRRPAVLGKQVRHQWPTRQSNACKHDEGQQEHAARRSTGPAERDERLIGEEAHKEPLVAKARPKRRKAQERGNDPSKHLHLHAPFEPLRQTAFYVLV